MDSGGTKARFKPSHYIVSTHTNVTIVYIPCAYSFTSSSFIYIRCPRKVVMLLEPF